MEFTVSKPQELESVARKILDGFSEKVFIFQGEMGAGKTTLIKAFCRVLESIDECTSPTFALVNVYETKGGNLINHFDFYRIKDSEEAMDIGFEEYLSSGQVCLIEWPERIMKLLFGNYVVVQVKAEDQSRIIKVHLHEPI